jgi:hypothetical protein
MKKYLMASALVVLAGAGSISAQSFSSSVSRPQNEVPKPSPAPPLAEPAQNGVVQTAIRHGNPAQMLNPRAPAQYGTAHQHVTHDVNDPGKPKGIKFFEWLF